MIEGLLVGGASILSLAVVRYIFLYKGYPSPLSAPYNFYDLSVEGLDGEMILFNQFRGKKVLLVNTASQCGFTDQYHDLQALYEKHKDHLVVLGLPCNQFFGQEPFENKQIKRFCQEYFKVSFPMSQKVAVKGKKQHPVFQRLTNKELNGKADVRVLWNFHKFLVSEEGERIKDFKPYVSPSEQAVISLITDENPSHTSKTLSSKQKTHILA